MILEYLNLNSEQVTRYNEALIALSDNHPYYKPEFLDIFYGGLELSKALLYSDDNGQPLVVMPFYLRPIDTGCNESCYDVISTWGYSGPAYSTDLPDDVLISFWEEVDRWYSENHVVSEFIRFKLNNNHEYYSGTLVEGMHNIKGVLRSPETIWSQYNRKVRKNINKARREGLEVRLFFATDITDHIFDQFYEVFEHTLDRTRAASNYYYSYEKLWKFIEVNPENVAIALTLINDKPIASEMILISNHSVFSFIGGTYSDHFSLRPNEILKHEIIKWAFNRGFKYFILGGGYGKDDGIFRYKQAFFPEDVCSYYTGRKIVEKEIYRKLAGIGDQDMKIEEDFFPLYRKPAVT